MKALLLALQYLPYVLAGVTAVEAALPGQSGLTKKSAVFAAIDAAAKVAGNVPEDHVAVVSNLIDSVVTVMNKSGVFAPKAVAAKA
jgi:hypothetical protein